MDIIHPNELHQIILPCVVWYKNSEEKPSRTGEYLIYDMPECGIEIAIYYTDLDQWYTEHCRQDKVRYWTYLPQAPE